MLLHCYDQYHTYPITQNVIVDDFLGESALDEDT